MKKILIIEDDPAMGDMYKKFLLSYFEVQIFPEGEQGFVNAVVWQPDLILLDLVLVGKESGMSTLEHLKQDDRTLKIPVIVISNLLNQERVIQKGAAVYLDKGNLSMEHLVEEINTHLPTQIKTPHPQA